MSLHVGIDTGGTFTDLVAFDDVTGTVITAKVASTPSDPARAIFSALERAEIEARDIDVLVLGTTVGTNALLERKGADVVFVTTEGFRDVPLIQRVDKENPYNLRWEKPTPLVRREDCLEVSERVLADGTVSRPLEDEEVNRICARVLERVGARDGERDVAVAVSLLFSFVSPEHERRLAAALRERLPGVPASFSHVVAPVWREYERASTTIVDAYLRPAIGRLVEQLERGLAERSFSGVLSIVKSNGGRTAAAAATDRPAELVLSGLAGGIVAGRQFGELAGSRDLVTLDMGGTSADVGVVRDGAIGHVDAYELEFGLPVALPAIDLTTVGAGGGSIAWIDDGGLLRVGPRSAGALPGPVCYDLGGEEVTVTDANLVLGRLDAERFLGGRMRLNREKARARVEELGNRLGLGPEETAHAVIELAVEHTAGAIRRVAVEKGVDVRELDLVAFGGAGPLHASSVAAALGIHRVIVPPHPGLASAFGTLVADRRVDRRTSWYARSDSVDVAELDRRLARLSADAAGALAAEGFVGSASLLRSASMRYVGQNHETEVLVPLGTVDAAAFERLLTAFHERHEALFGYASPDEPVEIVALTVTAVGAGDRPPLPERAPGPMPDPECVRPVWFPGGVGYAQTPVYAHERLPAGARLSGPAIIEDADSTTVLAPGDHLEVTPHGLLCITTRAEEAAHGRGAVDSVTLSVISSQLVHVTEEMGAQMMRAAYSPIFSESRDFSCALFNARGEMIAQGPFCPAHLGAIAHTVEFILDEIDVGRLEPGDVLLHNDPFRGGCHMPEHTVVRPIFHDGRIVAFAAVIGHLAEIGAVTVGSFAANATEAYQEGLRLPPVWLVRRGEPVADVWKILLANHRTPRHTWGDLHAMIAALRTAEERLAALFARSGADFVLEVADALVAYSERLVRAEIARVDDGTYEFEDCMEDDGVDGGERRIRVRVVVDGDRLVVDYTGTDPQAKGPINATYAVTTSATYNALFQLLGDAVPRNAGAHRATKTIAPPGTVVNVRFPGSSVGGNTETQPKLVGMILGALAPALPDRVMAAEGVTSCNFLFGGVHPRTGEYYAHYHFEASGWGALSSRDGTSAQNHIHGNCRNTPIEVFETRFPFVTERYELIPDSGGPGRRRGGLATRRVLTVTAPGVTVSALMDRVREGAWGLFGGQPGRPASIAVRRAGEPDFRSFVEAFGTSSPSKFANVVLRRGDSVRIESAGGGGYGPPTEREPELVLADVAAGLVTPAAARESYGLDYARAGVPSS